MITPRKIHLLLALLACSACTQSHDVPRETASTHRMNPPASAPVNMIGRLPSGGLDFRSIADTPEVVTLSFPMQRVDAARLQAAPGALLSKGARIAATPGNVVTITDASARIRAFVELANALQPGPPPPQCLSPSIIGSAIATYEMSAPPQAEAHPEI